MSLDFLELVGQINNKIKTPLDARQIAHARAIFNESMIAGIDPRFALSTAWQESTLGKSAIGDLQRGEDHAVGSMQVLRSTARGLGLEQEWLRSKAEYAKTGSTNPALDAKMGVALFKELATKNKATTFGDMAAGYNGGPKYIGKDYGKVQGYVQKISNHMGKFFGNGSRADWKQSVILAGGVAPAMSTGVGYAQAPIASGQTSQPVAAFSDLPAFPASNSAPPEQPVGNFETLFGATPGSKAPGDEMSGLLSFLPPVQSSPEDSVDPIDALKAILGDEYDKQYQSEDA